ncbi:MAG: acyltransferase family protein [Firmicutes bacterium]|nr:acyltransferase family protein [Bacillota bacterium]MCM1401579.1 acyltransferase family protein [Bacteroides sp.]MCM1477463.1 acyltransferase family protein [Bacteroides sp.]
MTLTAAKTTRVGWIDYAKVLAIFLVVLTHTHSDPTVSHAINGFIMPVFFFCSGFVFSMERNPRYGAFALKRFRQLVVPYLWINLLAWAAWVLVLRKYGNDAGEELQWHEPLVAVALGLPKGMVHDIPLWSLLCFFVVEVVYYPIKRYVIDNDSITAIIFLAAAAAVGWFTPDGGLNLPLTLAPALMATGFYALGHFVASHAGEFKWLTEPRIITLLIGVVLFRTGFSVNTPVDFYLLKLGNPLCFLLEATGGIICVVQTAAWLNRLFGDGKAIRFLSGGTLLVCGFHILMFALIKGVMLFGFHIEPAELTDGIGRGFLLALAAFALCQPAVWLIQRFAPRLVDYHKFGSATR